VAWPLTDDLKQLGQYRAERTAKTQDDEFHLDLRV
jgi:hypothetical protein